MGPAWQQLPALGICGFSGSGKTTLIEGVLPDLVAQGLTVAVLKHDVHGIRVDREGKDSDRLFQAGANVFLNAPEEGFFRYHGPDMELPERLRLLARNHDLVLVEGHKDSPLPKVWLLADGETAPPPGKEEIIQVLARDADRKKQLLNLLSGWLPRQWLAAPLYGCVLGSAADAPAHRVAARLEKVTERVVFAGDHLPDGGTPHVRIPGIPGANGPLSDVLAAMRWAPGASWLVCSADLERVSEKTVGWLLASRTPGVWGTVPNLEGGAFLALLDARADTWLEQLMMSGSLTQKNLIRHHKINTPPPPAEVLEELGVAPLRRAVG